MSALQDTSEGSWDQDEFGITAAAIRGYGRLLKAVGGKIRTHPSKDGGLICEDTRHPARPTIWRVCPDGAVLPDSQYNFLLRAFITGALPEGVARH